MKKYLYFPVEVATRELAARCLTAFIAAERGFDVLIGYQYTLFEHAHSLPCGLYLSKGSNALAVRNMSAVKSKGHITAAIEEENFFRILDGNPITYNNPHLSDVCDLYLAMGRDELKHLQSQLNTPPDIALCGNPRTDILRPDLRRVFEKDTQALRDQYGPYVLVNTNIGVLNSVSKLPIEDQFVQWLNMDIFDAALSEAEKRDVFEDYLMFERDNLANLKELLRGLAERDCTVLLRPHPGENKTFWNEYVASLDRGRIDVNNDGSHLPMTLAAELLVHSGCTTGVEALLLGVPTISMRSTHSKAASYYLSNMYNTAFSTAAETLTLVENHLAGSTELADVRSTMIAGMGEYLEALDTGPLAAQKAVDALEVLYDSSALGQGEVALESDRDLRIWREHEQYTTNEYNRRKFGLNQASVSDILAQFQGALNLFQSVKAQSLSETVTHISVQ